MKYHNRIEEEIATVEAMIGLYCRKCHGFSGMCADCREALSYATDRLRMCPHGDGKPTCLRCTIHCYRPDMRERIRRIMRFAGPRMMIFHPVMAIRHLLRELYLILPK